MFTCINMKIKTLFSSPDAKFVRAFFLPTEIDTSEGGLALYICNSSDRFYTGLVMDKNAIIHRS